MSAHSRSRGPSPSDSPTHTSRLSPDLSDQPPSAGLSTPPDELNGSDIKNSRKREREVSLEPATPQATTLEIGSETLDPKERRTPAKKNRTSDSLLEAPQEQAEDDHKLNGSPPHETKVRQISQGVEDLTWQNLNKDAPPDLDLTSKLSTSPTDLETNMETVTDPQLPSAQEDKIPPSVDTNSESDHQRETIVPPLARGENPPILSDTAGLEEDTVAAAGAEHPTDSHAPGAPGPSIETTPVNDSRKSIPDAPRFPSTQRRDSDSDQEKGLKRKLGDRTVSEALVPGDLPGGNGAATVGAMKRPRDDPEGDPNTREKKRPTPPPDEDDKQEKTTSTTPPPDVTPKFGGFMAYASTTSPFSNVSGPRIFGAKQPSTSPWAAASTSGSPTTSAFSSGGTASSFSSFASSTPPFSGASDFVGKDARDVSSSAASLSQAHKRTGFEAFSSSTSPFASAAKRPKSPPPTPSSVLRSRSPSRHGTPARSVNAFSAYAAGGAQGFAAPTPKRSPPLGEATSSGEPNVLGGSSSGHAGSALDGGKDSGSGEESESGKEDKKKGASFKEQLRAGKDREEEDEDEEQKRLNLTEQEVHTGEEEEDTVYQVRGKLFALSEANQWKERGTGMLRLNVRSEDGGGARLIMRKEAVYTVLLNATLFKGMRCFSAQDPRYIRFSVFEGNTTTHYNLRVSNAKIAEELLEEITAHIPTE